MVASIEATAAKLNIPVRIEGYEPPRDQTHGTSGSIP